MQAPPCSAPTPVLRPGAARSSYQLAVLGRPNTSTARVNEQHPRRLGVTVLTSRVVWKRCAYTEPVAVGTEMKIKQIFVRVCGMLRGITRRSGSLLCTKDHQGRCKQELEALLPFCRQFYGAANRHVWTDDAGDDHIDHEVLQAEGEEQGVMPALYALAQHAAVADVAATLEPGEAVVAFLDDTNVGCPPERVAPLFGAPSDALWARARV